MSRPLLIERLSLLQCLVLWGPLRRAQVLYVHQTGIPRLRRITRRERLCRRLIRFINPRISVEPVPAEMQVAHNWDANRTAVEEVDRRSSEIEHAPVYRLMRDLIEDEHLLKFYQAMLVGEVAEHRLFWAEAGSLATKHGSLIVVPATGDRPPVVPKKGNGARAGLFPACQRLDHVCDGLAQAAWLLVLAAVPVGYLLKRLRARRRPDTARYDVAVPVLYGVDGSAFDLTKTRTLRDDGSLYHDELSPGRVVHVFGAVRPRPDVEARFKRAFHARGLPYRDWREFALTAGFVRRALALQLRLLDGLIRVGWRRSPAYVIRDTARALHWWLAYSLELEHVHAAVEVVRDDYAPRHIIKTIVSRRHGRKTVGIQHAAGIYDMPHLAFLHLDHYAVCAEGYVRSYHPYWSGLRLERIGRESVDWIMRLVRDPALVQGVRDKLAEKYHPRRFMVVFVLPIALDPCQKWAELYSGLEEFIASSLDANIFLRLRRMIDVPHEPHLQKLVELVRKDERLIMEHEDFTTYELMAVADIVIANSASFAVYEAIATGAKVFTFDFLGTGRRFFGHYGKDFVLETKADLLRTLHGLERGFAGFDCRWDLVWQEGDYHYDGRNLERLRALVVRVARESVARTGVA